MTCLGCARVVPSLTDGLCGACSVESEMARGQAMVLREAERLILGDDCATARTPVVRDADLAAEALARLGVRG